MSINEKYISEEEIEKIESIKIDKKLEKKIKDKKEVTIYRELLMKALSNVERDLGEDESIEGYIIGRDYRSDTARLITATTGAIVGPATYVGYSYLGHPVFDWSAQLIIVKTNKRTILVSTAKYFKYLEHYEIENNIKLNLDKSVIYLTIRDLNGKEKILETVVKKEDLFKRIDELQLNVEVKDGKIKCKEKEILKKESRILFIIAFVLLMFFIFKLLTEGTITW